MHGYCLAYKGRRHDMTGHRNVHQNTRLGKFVLEDHRHFAVSKMIKIHHHCVLMLMKPAFDPDLQSFQ